MLSLSIETATQLRAKAQALGVPYSRLADDLLRVGLSIGQGEIVVPEPSHDVPGIVPGVGPPRPEDRSDLSKLERRLLVGFRRALVVEEPAFKIPTADIAKEAGMLVRDTLFALKRLQARGDVKITYAGEGEKVDRWGRPTNARWILRGTERVFRPGLGYGPDPE